MFRLECILQDAPGVVNRLVHAISELGINIVKQESCIINDGDHHYVECLLDWSTSRSLRKPRRTPSGALWRYRYMIQRIPIRDYRYVLLYERVVSSCKDVLAFDNAYGASLPSINIQPFSHRRTDRSVNATLIARRRNEPYLSSPSAPPEWSDQSRTSRAGLEVLLPLDPHHVNRVRRFTGYGETEALTYLLSSDGASRTMRVFFPTKRQAGRISHVAFRHQDHPGALSAISGMLKALHFNIHQSILRKSSEFESVWELIIEDRRSNGPSQPGPVYERDRRDWPAAWAQLSEWLSARIATVENAKAEGQRQRIALGGLTWRQLMNHYGIQLVPPFYPRIPTTSTERAGMPMNGDSDDTVAVDGPLAAIECIDETSLPPYRGNAAGRSERSIIDDVQRGRSAMVPSVFLSYSRNASGHVAYLKRELKDLFELVEYQDADFVDIVAGTITRIQQCDYFIAVWHHEEHSRGDEHSVSPWMPFEYGAALAAEKDTIVVFSDKLPGYIRERINAGIAHPQYSDVSFWDHTVPQIVEHCTRYWARGRRPSGFSPPPQT